MRVKNRLIFVVGGALALAGAVLLPVAHAQSSAPERSRASLKPGAGPDQGAPMSGTMSVEAFVSQACIDGLTEVQIAHLALNNSQNDAVRQYAQRILTDHGKFNAELLAIASRKNISAPQQLDAEHQASIRTLSAKHGAEFDSAYANEMVLAHDKAIALFKAGSGVRDPDIAAFASKILPALQAHKMAAETLKSSKSG